MNTFRFIGNIIKPKDGQFIKKLSNGNKIMKLIIRQNETNFAYVQLSSNNIYNGTIPVMIQNEGGRQSITYEDRFNEKLIQNVSPISKVVTNLNVTNGKDLQFIYYQDFMDYIDTALEEYSKDTLFEIKGEFSISEYNGKLYNNFNIRSIRTTKETIPEFTMTLNLFYNHESFDESDKRNKFVLNAYIEQYMYAAKSNKYLPIRVEYYTNRFNFKNPADVEIIKHRKANMFPPKEDGNVKATWEAQYVRGAQLIMPPLETLPKNIQFEIKNAGRDIREYMSNVISEAQEIICLTRPDNTMSKEGEVYTKLNCTDNEFRSNIYETIISQGETIDNLAKEDAKQNPFN